MKTRRLIDTEQNVEHTKLLELRQVYTKRVFLSGRYMRVESRYSFSKFKNLFKLGYIKTSDTNLYLSVMEKTKTGFYSEHMNAYIFFKRERVFVSIIDLNSYQVSDMLDALEEAYTHGINLIPHTMTQ